MVGWCCRYRCRLLYWVVCEASQVAEAVAEAERGASLSVEETGRRGRRGCCARIGEGKGQLVEKGDDKAQIGKRIY